VRKVLPDRYFDLKNIPQRRPLPPDEKAFDAAPPVKRLIGRDIPKKQLHREISN
jgi:hypothetical protein